MSDDDRIARMPAKSQPGPRCPTCGRPTVRRFRPFCSKRCADLDLGRWLKGSYRVPTEEAPQEGDHRAEGEE